MVKEITYVADASGVGQNHFRIRRIDGGYCSAPSAVTGGKFNVFSMGAGYGTTYTAGGVMGGTFGIRYNFDYNRGNPVRA